MKSLRIFILLVVLLVIAGGAFVYSGIYDIGADAPHWAVTRSVIDALRERSIDRRAADIQVPSNLDDPARLREGAEHYSEMCTGCHLAPGLGESELRTGLYPAPPDFSRMPPVDARHAFWVIKHGIKLTAMPAWGKTHSDEKIWDMVAFVRRLPRMSPAQYKAATANTGHDDDDNAAPAAAPAAAASSASTPAPAAGSSSH